MSHFHIVLSYVKAKTTFSVKQKILNLKKSIKSATKPRKPVYEDCLRISFYLVLLDER